MLLLVGLGNPGAGYSANRHNIGFMLVDRIAADYDFPAFSGKFSGLVARGRIGQHEIMLLKPQNFMNNSGASVQATASFYKIPPEKIIVIHDELDLPTGKIRIKKGGGNGGHNGLKSIDAAIGADYWRVRIGIDHPGIKEKVISHVLSDFYPEELEIQEKLLASVSKNLPLWLDSGDANRLVTAVAL